MWVNPAKFFTGNSRLEILYSHQGKNNTPQAMRAKFNGFEAHGTLDLRVEGRVLIVEGTGPWNMESIKSSGAKAEPLIKQLSGEPWVALVILHGESIYVPSAMNSLIQAVSHERSLGRCATALLVNDCFSPGFAKQHLAEIYQKANEIYEFFDDTDHARQWLNSQLEQNSTNC